MKECTCSTDGSRGRHRGDAEPNQGLEGSTSFLPLCLTRMAARLPARSQLAQGYRGPERGDQQEDTKVMRREVDSVRETPPFMLAPCF